jgi:hypothetical protein
VTASARSHARIRRTPAGRAWLNSRARTGSPRKTWARLLGPTSLPETPSTEDDDRAALLVGYVTTALRHRLDRLDRPTTTTEVPAWKVQAVRVADCAHTLAAPPGQRLVHTSQECLFCGELAAYVGSGRCYGCATLGRRYEVVA